MRKSEYWNKNETQIGISDKEESRKYNREKNRRKREISKRDNEEQTEGWKEK